MSHASPFSATVQPLTSPLCRTDSPRILLIGGCGYIGSYLQQRLKAQELQFVVYDRLARGNPLGGPVIQRDYADLEAEELAGFDAVLWFGGHSSVGQAVQDPNGAVANNCLNLFSFAKRLNAHTKLIYASSGSLYSTRQGSTTPANEQQVAVIPSQNAYDISKFAFDYLAQNFLQNFYALRMGTLSGYSPNLRQELVFNAMNLSALRTGRVHLKNSESSRTILFLEDLWCLIRKLLLTDQKPGIFNVGSLSFKMGDLAHDIAKTWDAQVIYEGESETYSFLLDNTRMRAICGNDLRHADVASRCREFIKDCEAAGLVSTRDLLVPA